MKDFEVKDLKNPLIYERLCSEVPLGHYKLWDTPEFPDYLARHGKHAYCNLLVTATIPSENFMISDHRPHGTVLTLQYFRDDIHSFSGRSGQHFNKDCEIFFSCKDGKIHTLSFLDDDHLVDATATGTSNVVLWSSFKLPIIKKFGKISELPDSLKINFQQWNDK